MNWRAFSIAVLAMIAVAQAQAQPAQKKFVPKVGLVGKDVIWAPTPQALVDKMLDMAKVNADDTLIDLGSGDGRTVITAAKRGARALGIEYNLELVELSKRKAEREGVAGKASFVKADLFESDFSQATVITMFLLPDLNLRLRPKLLALKPGTRVVSSLFDMGAWQADDSAKVISLKNLFAPLLREIRRFIPASLSEDLIDYCDFYCTAYLWIVPARVAGTWQLARGEITLKQSYQKIEGALRSGTHSIPLASGRLRGDQISFSIGGIEYTGRVSGDCIEGRVGSGANSSAWSTTLRAERLIE